MGEYMGTQDSIAPAGRPSQGSERANYVTGVTRVGAGVGYSQRSEWTLLNALAVPEHQVQSFVRGSIFLVQIGQDFKAS